MRLAEYCSLIIYVYSNIQVYPWLKYFIAKSLFQIYVCNSTEGKGIAVTFSQPSRTFDKVSVFKDIKVVSCHTFTIVWIVLFNIYHFNVTLTHNSISLLLPIPYVSNTKVAALLTYEAF
jgi:hypothetical protein